MTSWCDVDSDPDEVTSYLRAYPDREFSLWLQDDLRRAISDHDFTPELLAKLTYISFRDQEAVDAWLRNIWTTWFPGNPYHGG